MRMAKFISKWLRYGLVGVASAVLYVLLANSLFSVVNSVFLSTSAAYVLSHPLSFISHSLFTYRRPPTWSAYGKYWIGSGVTAISTFSIGALGTLLSMPISTVSVIVVVATPVSQILMNELYTFRRKSRRDS